MKSVKYFLAAIVISFPLWWGLNSFSFTLEDYFAGTSFAYEDKILNASAQEAVLSQKLESAKPIKKGNIENLELGARAAISIHLNKETNSEKSLFEKQGDVILPIASLTKLMTAYVVLENYSLDEIVSISKDAIDQDEEFGQLKAGENIKVSELLYPLLMESSNDAAYALAEVIGVESFVDLMNMEAKNMGLKNTHFVNPTGLNEENATATKYLNYSTVKDLSRMTELLLKNPLIWDILSQTDYYLYTDGVFHHKLENTNELLKTEENWGKRIIGGKTGWTPEAKGCLIIVLKDPNNGGYLINVVLSSDDRFLEMTKLINWVEESYRW